MLQQLKNSGRLKITVLLALMSLFCLFLSVFRFFYSDNKVYLFLNWNLFLAFIPWLAGTVIYLNKKYSTNKFVLTALLSVWMLFFPNSPYILTDLFHLQQRGSVPIWFDLVVVLSFAWTGLAYGFISLVDIQQHLSKYMKQRSVKLITVVLLFIGSFGIYLGRFLRWNSWDIINQPFSAQWNIRLGEITDRFINPFSHPRTWGVTILMGILLNMMFWTVSLLTRKEEKTLQTIKTNNV